ASAVPPTTRPTPFPYTTLFRSRSQRHYPVPLANDTRNHRLLALPIQHDPRAALSAVDFFQLIQRNFVLPPPIKVDHRMRNYCARSEEHTSGLQSPDHLVCRLLL